MPTDQTSSVVLYVTSFDSGYMDLSWELSTEKPSYTYEWRVSRSESPAGPFTPVSTWLSEVYRFRDTTLGTGAKLRTFYYILEVRVKGETSSERYGPYYQRAIPDLIGLELIRQVRMEMELSGVRAYLFPMRTMGVRCSSCYDSITGKKIKSNCLDCFDTTIAGGYYSPIPIFCDLTEPQADSVVRDIATVSDTNINMRLANFPIVKPRDVIITGTNDRYRVERTNDKRHRDCPYEQNAMLHAIPKNDIEYKLPLLIDPQEFSVNPDERVHTLPTGEESLTDDALWEMISTFGGVKV